MNSPTSANRIDSNSVEGGDVVTFGYQRKFFRLKSNTLLQNYVHPNNDNKITQPSNNPNPAIDHNAESEVSYERLEISWYELAFPLTILTIVLLAILLAVGLCVLWLKRHIFNTTAKSTANSRIEAQEGTIRIMDADIGQVEKCNDGPPSSPPSPLPPLSPHTFSPPTSPSLNYPQQQPLMKSMSAPSLPLPGTSSQPQHSTAHFSNAVPMPVAVAIPALPITRHHHSSYSSGETSPALSPSPGTISHRTVTIVHKPHVPKITQKDLSTPPPPPPTSSASSSASSIKRFSFQPIPKPIDLAPMASNNAEWILHDSTILALSQPSGDVYCVQPPVASVCSSVAVSSTGAPSPIINYHYKPCWSPKVLQEDKENAYPYGAGPNSAANSPKIIHQRYGSDIALQQQNSPRVLESGSSNGSRFTFSPKLLHQQNIDDQFTGSGGITSINSAGISSTNSPFMSSAGYKHGNYFRFPDVDVCTPTGVATKSKTKILPASPKFRKEAGPISIEIITSRDDDTDDNDGNNDFDIDGELKVLKLMDNVGTTACPKSQATRRARLKSISLDSDGARLVEENLGIPVEELVEISSSPDVYNNNTTSQSGDMHQDRGKNNNKCGEVTSGDRSDNDLDDKNEEDFSYLDPPHYHHEIPASQSSAAAAIPVKYSQKNKNHLSIHVDSIADDRDIGFDDNNFQRSPTPKTPTLTQTRQKAISLDSDPVYDTLMSACPSSKEAVVGSSTLNISSMSVPTTPKRRPLSLSAAPSNNECTHGRFFQKQQQHQLAQQQMKLTKLKQPKAFYSFKQQHQLDTVIDVTNGLRKKGDTQERSGFVFSQKLGSFHEQMSNMQDSIDVKSTQSGDYLGSNLQNIKSTTLSVSNNNLKTLPEVMTLSDFGTTPMHTGTGGGASDVDNLVQNSNVNFGTPTHSDGGFINKSRSSILQRRGSNHSLTLNVDGSTNSLHQGLSASNYSLSNLKGSHCSLSGTAFTFDGSVTGASAAAMTIQRHKANLLQRRGSNTSLTLNIQGSSNSLNRFNSHSSLNISDGRHKKNLLERRNSNTSLTLNIQNRGLSISNCNLRGSECSLNMESFDTSTQPQAEQADTHHHSNAHHRKFLSSENLHNFSICPIEDLDATPLGTGAIGNSAPNQHHQHHHGSVSDLKNHRSESGPNGMTLLMGATGRSDVCRSGVTTKRESHCDCGIRNITTKPLSPQTTSEDFKIYLANIQMLQNASNVLSEQQLRNLNHIFQKSYKQRSVHYSRKPPPMPPPPVYPIDYENIIDADDTTIIIGGDDQCIDDDRTDQEAELTELPSDDSQKLLLRNLHQEFWDLPTNYQEKPLVFGSQAKNRYKTILPNEHSRVLLKSEVGQLAEPYINANFIKVSVPTYLLV